VTAAARRRSLGLETLAVAGGGGALAVAAWWRFGLGPVAGVVGAASGALAGRHRIYRWRTPTGPLAFALDSTWALPTTAAALLAHAVAALQRRPDNRVAELSERCDRHVYVRGLTVRPGFMLTIGNVVNGAGADVRTSPWRQRIVVEHEHAHVWQARWFGPLFPLGYLVWSVGGGIVGAAAWVLGGRRERLAQSVETCAYYLNPFEWWAYSREGRWPPPGAITRLAWRRPLAAARPPAR
jgi:hypothetical protein